MNNEPILKSQISVVYVATIFIFLIILLPVDINFFASHTTWQFAVGIACLLSYLFYLADFIFTSKKIIFYKDHLELKYIFLQKKQSVQYDELIKIKITIVDYGRRAGSNFQFYQDNSPYYQNSENDITTLTLQNNKKIRISEYRYDNYFKIQSLLKRIFAEEDLESEII